MTERSQLKAFELNCGDMEIWGLRLGHIIWQ